MSNALFPTLPGLSWGSTKEPMWTTQAKRSASGMEQRAGYMSYPLYRIKLSYEFLRAGAEAELQTLVGFFNQRGGDLETFLFDDPADNTAVDQQFGIGDGTTTVFRLGRTLGGAYEPVSAVVDAATADPYRNYLTYPEQFDHATWTQTPNADVDVTANATTSPTGAVVAEKVFEATTANVLHQIAQTFVSAENTTYVFSTYVKAAERTRLALYFRARNGSYPYAVFNLVTGAVTEQSAGVSAGIESIGDGWYRCYISANLGLGSFPGAVYIELRQPTGGTTYAGTVGSGLYVWGAQVERDSYPGTYLSAPEIIQSHNYLLYSEQIENAAWTKNGATTVLGNQTAAPNASGTADRVTSPQDLGVYQAAIVTSGAVHTVSAYVKQISTASLRFRDTSGSGHHVDINLSTGAITASSNVTASGAEDAGAGWWRVWMTYTTDTTAITINPRPNDPGTTVFDLWGVQIEKAAQLGDYFATTTPNKPAAAYTIDPNTAVVTYTTAPAAGTPLLWSGRFYKRVKFEKSNLEFKEFLRDLWEAKSVALLTVKT